MKTQILKLPPPLQRFLWEAIGFGIWHCGENVAQAIIERCEVPECEEVDEFEEELMRSKRSRHNGQYSKFKRRFKVAYILNITR